MNRHVQQITKRLTENLPEDNQYYRLDELRSKGFPAFIVQRMRLEVARNLAESMIPPKTDWANIQSEAVQTSWQQFVDAIRAEAHLPASFAKAVVETAVAEVLEILTQPRKSIPDVVFGADDELDYDEVCERAKAVVVYRHFGQLISGYMQKKELEKLSRQRCTKVIENVDEKLTKQYSPLNWAQMLEPLFKLLNNKIDTDLLRLFFEDKGKEHIARRFDAMNSSLTRVQLIETLSSPDLLSSESYEDYQSPGFDELPYMQTPEKAKENGKNTNEEKTAGGEKSNGEKPLAENDNDTANKESEFSIKGLVEPEPEEREEEVQSINDAFAIDVAAEDGNPQLEETAAQGSFEPETEEKNGSDGRNAEEETSFEGLNEERPMWMRFFDEQEDGNSASKFVNSENTGNRFTTISDNADEPVMDLPKRPDPIVDERDELIKQLASDKDLFIEEIFGGSVKAYNEAIDEIAKYKSWSSASKYIEKEIFKRNLVNIYSESAVNFTDRLQDYFTEKQKRN